MKLLRYGSKGQEKPGVLDRGGNIRDLSGKLREIDPSSVDPAILSESW